MKTTQTERIYTSPQLRVFKTTPNLPLCSSNFSFSNESLDDSEDFDGEWF